jgi:peptide/nickel transport system substrate-binding protein
MHWCDPSATQADKAARANPDERFRRQQYQTLYGAIQDQVPAIFLYAFPTITVARNTIQNYQPGPFGPTQTTEIWNWWRTDDHGLQL